MNNEEKATLARVYQHLIEARTSLLLSKKEDVPPSMPALSRVSLAAAILAKLSEQGE